MHKFGHLVGLLVVFGLVMLSTSSVYASETVKDNSFSFDKERLEKEANETLGEESERTAGLFQSEEVSAFQVNKNLVEEATSKGRAQLFQGDSLKLPSPETDTLFLDTTDPNTHARHIASQADSQVGLSVDGLWLSAGYLGLLLLVFIVAGYGSYKLGRED